MLPYQTLYIYEISGEIPDSRRFFRDDYIGCWNEGEISFLFFSAPHDEEVEVLIRRKRMALLSRNVLDYKAWQAGEELKPFKIGDLVISPPWEESIVGQGETLIRLDPCVVFGTGYHPTTRSCLQALWKIYRLETPEKVLDLGTGSGILALAAAKWGAGSVLAVDSNELAADTALKNVRLNGESQRIEVRRGRAEDFIEKEADLLCANLHFQVIESLLSRRAFFKKRWLVLSGFFVRDGDEIERRLKGRSVRIQEKLREKNWMTLVGLSDA
jgi:ribosomal protein L11 methyltransferase